MPAVVRRGLTLLGIALANLTDQRFVQLVLPFPRELRLTAELALARDRAVDTAVDRVRERFGVGALTRGVLLGRGQEVSIPLLPD